VISVGVIGYGYWGPNLVRNFAEMENTRVARVCDLSPKRLELVRRRYPTVPVGTDWRELIADPAVDAVVIATPVSTHFELAMGALRAGKHVLVEKPLAASAEEARRLIDEAARRRLILLVDHTFVYTGAVRKVRELVRDGGLGDIYYYDSVRVNLGLFQHDVNVLWDLAVHDLAIMDYVLGRRPEAVSATGMSHVAGSPEDVAYLTLFFDDSLIAHIHANWLAPVKLRRTLIGGRRKMIVYDDIEPSEKLKVYDKGITVQEDAENIYKLLISYRTGEMYAPQFDTTEALAVEARHFAECVGAERRPITDGEAGLRVLNVLEAATESLSRRGELVRVRP
jgi:predicted dehydrogenase